MATQVAYLLIVVSIVLGVSGQTAIKLGINALDLAPQLTVPLSSVVMRALLSGKVLLGLAAYALSALAWIGVLSRLDLSRAYPFLALNFVLIALVSRFFLGEEIPLLRWLGIGCIVAGIFLVARSG